MATNAQRDRRHRRVRARVSGESERPRVCVFRSNSNMYVQIVDDVSRKTVAAGDTRTLSKGEPVRKATELGKILGKALKEKGIEKAVFDRGGYRYHGRVKAVAEGLRESGISI